MRLLGGVTLLDLTEPHITGYMKARLGEGAANRTINMELLCLARAAGRTWRQLWPTVARLEEPSDIGRALSSEEEGRLLGAAKCQWTQPGSPASTPTSTTLLYGKSSLPPSPFPLP